MTGRAGIVFTFPEPDSDTEMMSLVANAKELFEDKPELKVHLVVRDAADEIVEILNPKQSNLVQHAIRELDRIETDEDFKKSIIRAVRGFSSYGHSGGSAGVAIQVIHDLLQQKNLSPLTDDSKEWMRHDDGVWQNVRNGEAFSPNGGKHYYLLSEGGRFDKPEPLHKTEPISPVEPTDG